MADERLVSLLRERNLPIELAGSIASLVEELTGQRGGPVASARRESFDTFFDDGGVRPLVVQARPVRLPERFVDRGLLGRGGMGEVRRVFDAELGRTCAMKVIHADFTGNAAVRERFLAEARVAAQLQHPNIPPLYDAGVLEDGRPWLLLKEIHGATLSELIRENAPLRRLVDAFAKVCDAIGYAHARGVVHRDLKPDNVMVGAHGEVLVLDWGLATLLDRADLTGDAPVQRPGAGGTAAWMPPEQARGELVDTRADVYSLGALLYAILSGRPPYTGPHHASIVAAVLQGPPASLRGEGPDELVELCELCMARDPGDRPETGDAVAGAARAWLDGDRELQRARAIAAEGEATLASAAALRAEARALRDRGRQLLEGVAAWASEDEKAAGWACEDEAERRDREALDVEIRRESLLRGALTHAPSLIEANEALARVEIARHAEAESVRDQRAAALAEARIREHARALPANNPVRGAAESWLRGDGALTLHTDPPGATVTLFRYETDNRRAVAVDPRPRGKTPLDAVPLRMGSYLCVLSHPGRIDVNYPVHIGREQHWDGRPPGAADPLPVRLPRAAELGPDDCYVPAGWFLAGGDAAVNDPLPRMRLWCDALVVRRFPVTHAEYIAFLDDLVQSGQEARALELQPHERTAATALYGRAEGRFTLVPDADGDLIAPDWPVYLVDWFSAQAYADWLAARTGRPWRLLGELEWEKAARGVDGRYYPWGDRIDPSWCCIGASHRGRPLPAPVDSFPVDESPYGVRGLAGNTQDWCADEHGPISLPDGSAVAEPLRTTSGAARAIRGGNWVARGTILRSAARSATVPTFRSEFLGFRVAYRYEPSPHSR